MNKKIAMIFTLLAVTSMTLTACGERYIGVGLGNYP